MSFTTLQVGQAGNQIGLELWKLLRKEIPEYADTMFDSLNSEKARCVLVDTEPKVVNKYIEDDTLKEFFKKENIFSTEEGRGNNWAFGYTYVEDSFDEKILDCIRHEAENCDFYEGMLMIHSIAGGTGSGLGSRLMEKFKDQYGKAKLINVVVWPHPSGETPLQNYNSCFTTSFLQKYSDSVIIFENESMLKLIPKCIDGKKVHSISMKNLNEYISVCLKNILTPCSDEKISLYDICELSPVPQLKLLSCNSNPFIFNEELSCDKFKEWQDIITTGFNQITHLKGTPYLVSGKTYCRYKETGAFDTLPSHLTKKVNSKYKSVSWSSTALTHVLTNETPFYSQKSCPFSFAFLSNSTISTRPLKNILKYGRSKFKSKAYLHWYDKYGMGEEEFCEAFRYVDETVEAYEKGIL
ncbi:unnamed protein product [Moneuplotes crassus]|uniref:Tubulin delta chain n=1 Tax=Euplotes crassus TaxID=5936 RepID=A0AAD1XFT9_EUPCR|nr:unnamed protein product [Moneuplotes crassus]